MDIIFNPVCQIPIPCPCLYAEALAFRHAGVNVIRVRFEITLRRPCLPCNVSGLGPTVRGRPEVEGKAPQFLYRKKEA